MSQVHIEKIKNSIVGCVHYLGATGSVLVVGQPAESREFKRVVFPRETHHAQAEETVYTEHVTRYEVIRVVHSPDIVEGGTIWVWSEPAYGQDSMRAYHEEGLSESPIVMESEPVHPVEGEQQIVFTRPIPLSSAEFVSLHAIDAHEGLGAEQEIRELLSRRETLVDQVFPVVDDDRGVLSED